MLNKPDQDDRVTSGNPVPLYLFIDRCVSNERKADLGFSSD